MELRGRNARRHAARSAISARYFFRPPLASTSRHTVERARPSSAAAIAGIDHPVARPRENGEPKLTALPEALVASPRHRAMNLRNEEICRPRCLAMRLTGTPRSRMSQILALSASLKRLHTRTPPDRPHHCPPIRLVLQRPLEDTAVRRHGQGWPRSGLLGTRYRQPVEATGGSCPEPSTSGRGGGGPWRAVGPLPANLGGLEPHALAGTSPSIRDRRFRYLAPEVRHASQTR